MGNSISWAESKNERLRRRHGVGFEEVVIALEQGQLLDHREHPNRDRYGYQKQLVVEIEGYAYVVPYVEDGEKRFFKTLFPSRKDTRDYTLMIHDIYFSERLKV